MSLRTHSHRQNENNSFLKLKNPAEGIIILKVPEDILKD